MVRAVRATVSARGYLCNQLSDNNLWVGPIVALGYPKRAARLLGAANAHLELIGSYQQPADQPEIELFLKNAQEALTKDAFQTAWVEGQRMTIQEAVAYALSDEQAE